MFDIILNKSLQEKAVKLGFQKAFFLDKSLIIKTGKLDELMRKVSSMHSKNIPIIVLGSEDDINRKATEDKRISMLLNPEETREKDFIHQRNSGLNHVLCRFASENNIKIGINVSSLFKLNPKERALKISRIMQNIVLCRKYRPKMLIASFAESAEELLTPYELKSIGIVFGMTPKQANESLETAKEILK